MNGYYAKEKGVLNIRVDNIEIFSELMERAQKEAHQLNRTIDELKRFELEIRFNVEEQSLK